MHGLDRCVTEKPMRDLLVEILQRSNTASDVLDNRQHAGWSRVVFIEEQYSSGHEISMLTFLIKNFVEEI